MSFLVLLPVGGCWDADSIEQLDYVRALGIDYIDGQYVAYLQLPNLANVAKKETPPQEIPNKSWMAIGKGKSINLAVREIFQTSSKKIIMGQTTVLVLGEHILQREELQDIFEDLNRFRELRYTMWVYGTKASIPELFDVSPTFYQSRNYTILQNPIDNYKKLSLIRPLRLHDFMNDYQDKASYALLPSIGLSTNNWSAGDKPLDMQLFDGVYVFHQGAFNSFLSLEKIKGLRLVDRHTVSTAINLEQDGKSVATLGLQHPRAKFQYDIQGEQVAFMIDVKISATLIELHSALDLKQLEQLAKKQIEEEIRSTYLNGVKTQTDIYELGDRIYSNDPALFNKLSKEGTQFFLKPESLGEIKIKVVLDYLGKYKFIE
jgi:Ger(x)C family germination protein